MKSNETLASCSNCCAVLQLSVRASPTPLGQTSYTWLDYTWLAGTTHGWDYNQSVTWLGLMAEAGYNKKSRDGNKNVFQGIVMMTSCFFNFHIEIEIC